MTKLNVIRAWRDKEYRESLNQQELATLPAHPAGLIELPDEVLNSAAGGTSIIVKTRDTCTPSCPTHIFASTCGLAGTCKTRKCSIFSPLTFPGVAGCSYYRL
jgi:mersacidin/lichenicidin family type 2 lantibiotic